MSVNCSFVHIGVAIGGVDEAVLASSSSPLLLLPLGPQQVWSVFISAFNSALHRWLCIATGDVGKESL